MPVYNTEKYLEKCLESIVSQSLKEIEVILVDDGSTDNSGKICDEWAKKDSRLKAIHQENSGRVQARLNGLRHATPDIVGFVDSDDFIETNMYEVMFGLMKKHNVDLVDCAYWKYVDEHDVQIVKDDLSEGLHQPSEFPYIKKIFCGGVQGKKIIQSHCTRIYDTRIITYAMKQLDSSMELGEDGICNFLYLQKINSMYVSHQPLYHYRIHSESSVQRHDESYLYQVNKYYESYLTAIKGDELEKELRKIIEKKIIFLTISGLNRMFSYQKLNYKGYIIDAKPLKNMKVVIYGAGTVGQDIYT